MFSLPKTKILRRKREFQTVYAEGRSYANRYLVIYVLENLELAGKAGFAAGKKLGGAVIRNRLKRLLRECYRLHQHEIKPQLALLLVARRPLAEEKYVGAETAFLSLALRAGILSESYNEKNIDSND